MMTKEEIQRSITELQYQYQSLIREGSYKLAKIRKERIKKLREQLKQLSKAKVQDSMDILRLCGYTNDAGVIMNLKANLGGHFSIYTDGTLEYYDPFGNKKGTRKFPNPREAEKYVRENFAITKDSAVQVGPWTIYQEGGEISVHRGGRAWAQGFKSVQEAKAWIQKKERWIETGKDEDPIFTKGTTKDKTKVVGQVGSVKIYYDDNDDIYYVNQGGSIFNNPGFKTKQEAINYVVKNNTTKDATSYKPGDRVTIAGGYSARIMSENNGTYIAQLPSGKKIELIANEILSKDDDATEHGSIEQYGKGTKTESMGLSDDPVLAQDSWTSVYEKAFGNQSMSTLESLKSKSDIIRHFQKLGIDPNSADAKEAMRRWFNSDSKPVKDADPKVAEAQAIINLCGGIF